MEDKQRSIYVDDELWKRLKIKAAKEDTSVSSLIKRAIRQTYGDEPN